MEEKYTYIQTVPERRRKLGFYEIKPFLVMTDQYRKIRSSLRNKMQSCFICKREIKNGETIYLAYSTKGNKVICKEHYTEITGKTDEFVTEEKAVGGN